MGWPLSKNAANAALIFLRPIHSALTHPFLPHCVLPLCQIPTKLLFIFTEFLNSPLFPFIYYFAVRELFNQPTNQKMPMPVDAPNSGEIVQQQIIFGDFSSAETEAEASSAFPLNSSTMEEDGADEVCTNSHVSNMAKKSSKIN
jgi:hypothetical protein